MGVESCDFIKPNIPQPSSPFEQDLDMPDRFLIQVHGVHRRALQRGRTIAQRNYPAARNDSPAGRQNHIPMGPNVQRERQQLPPQALVATTEQDVEEAVAGDEVPPVEEPDYVFEEDRQ